MDRASTGRGEPSSAVAAKTLDHSSTDISPVSSNRRPRSASAGSLLLLDRSTNELVFQVIEGGGGVALEGTRMPADKGIAGWVASHREPLIVDDVNRDDRHYRDIAKDSDFTTTSLLCVPMIARGQVIGVLQVLNKKPGKYFNTADQELLTTFAAQSAVAIENEYEPGST